MLSGGELSRIDLKRRRDVRETRQTARKQYDSKMLVQLLVLFSIKPVICFLETGSGT
jgi:hypothetical protein